MSTPNYFLLATKCNLRFATSRGQFTTEDLWSLSLEDLDRLAVAVDERISKAPKKSFITANVQTDAGDVLRLEILKLVIAEKLEDQQASKTRAAVQAQRAFLQDLIEKKRADQLGQLSLAELEAKLAAAGTPA